MGNPVKMAAIAASLVSTAAGGDPPVVTAVPAEAATMLGEKLENLGLLYRNESDPVLQELWFLGRYHGQYHLAEGSNGRDEDWENRRFRIGGQARLLRNLTVHAQMVSGREMDPIYNGFTELWAGWRFSEAVTLTVGQQKHRFTHDRNVSSRYLNYFERGMLTNMFALDYTPGVTLSGKAGEWGYYAGVFSNATTSDKWSAFTELDSGWSFLASATLDLGQAFGADTAHLNVGYVRSDANGNATNLNWFDNGVAAALILTEGPFSLVAEATAGLGSVAGANDFGINLQPTWFITDKLQLATRYQLAVSDEDNGLSAQRRYERAAGMSTGDLYQAVYAGLNYHVAAHRIKLMSGMEYATLGGEDCWTVSVMLRVFWGPHSKGPFPMAQMLKGTF
ncbi:MAG: Phosphate-selective porin O and P [Verrucomicrobia bacterium]|nr:MAG: Phosphate-selective porin O and P [Verrucomicrobiota bacterium]